MTRKNKRGREAAISIAAALCLLLCSCGSDEKGKEQGVGDSSVALDSSMTETSVEKFTADPMGRLAGIYYVDGDSRAAYVVVEADGSFTAYYASGTAEQRGYIRYETDNSDSDPINVYVFYTEEGHPYMGFADSGEAQISGFETGNGDVKYIRSDNG